MGVLISIISLIGIAVVVYFFIKSKNPSPSPVPQPQPTATGWTFQYSRNVPAQMNANADGTYYFDFPAGDGVHYIVKPAGSLQLGQTVTLDFNLQGDGTVRSVQGNTAPAYVSLYIQRTGDNLGGVGEYQQYRYFHTSAALVNGDGTLSTTLTPDQWSDVYGKKGTDFPTQFQACLTNAAVIGFVFGDPGQGATGHGAYVDGGTARFTLKRFSVQ